MRLVSLVAVLLLASCTLLYPIDALVDEGPADAGDAGDSADSGEEADAGEVDAGEADAGEVDAGDADAGGVDAGFSDAGDAPTFIDCAGAWCREQFTLRDSRGVEVTQGAWNAVTGLAADDVWIAGQNSVIAHWDGRTWTVEHSSFGGVNAIAIASDGRGFAVGRDGAGNARVLERTTSGAWLVASRPAMSTLSELRAVAVRLRGQELRAWAVGGSSELWSYASGVWSVSSLSGGRSASTLVALPSMLLLGGTGVPFTLEDGSGALEEGTTAMPFQFFYDGIEGVYGVTQGAWFSRSGTVNLVRQSWAANGIDDAPDSTALGICGRPGHLLVPIWRTPAGAAESYEALHVDTPLQAARVVLPTIEVLSSCWVAPTGESWIVGYTGFQPPHGEVLFRPAP